MIVAALALATSLVSVQVGSPAEQGSTGASGPGGTVSPLVEGLDFGMPGPALLPPVFMLAGVATDDAGSLYVSTAEGVFRDDPQA